MSILSTFSPSLPPDRMTGREVRSPSLTQELLEKLTVPFSQKEEVFQSNFKVILGNLNELQTPTPPTSADVNGKFFSTRPTTSAPPSKFQDVSHKLQQDDSFSAASSVVENPVHQQTSADKKEGEAVKAETVTVDAEESLEVGYEVDSTQPKTINLQQLVKAEDALKGEEMPIALTQIFIQDTLQEINTQQLRTFDQALALPLPITSLEEGTASTELLSGLPQIINPVQIEVQAAPTIPSPVLLEDAQQAVLLFEEEPEIAFDFKGDERQGSEEEGPLTASEGDLPSSTKVEAIRSSQKSEGSAIFSSALQVENRQSKDSISTPKESTNGTPSLFVSPSFSAASSLPAFNIALNRSNLDRVNTLMQLKDHFQSMIKNQETHLKVNLLPAELGRIEITLDLSKDTVISTLIRAERRETMEFLARHAEDLNQILQEAGLHSNLTNMNFSSEEEAPSSPFIKDKTSSSAEEEKAAEAEDIYEITDPDAWVNVKA